jgi:hypothetical protein
MHDIDRVLLEHESVAQEGEDEQFLFEDELGEQEEFFEQEDELEGQLREEEHEHSLSETQEIELANQALEIGSEEELEQFLSELFKQTTDPAGRFGRSKTGRQLAGMLKQAAVQALPAVGGAVAGRAGSSTRKSLADAATCFGLEPEAMTAEEGEFELGRQFVRFADCATRHARRLFNSAPPEHVARRAVTSAARRHAPGLPLRKVLAAPPTRRPTMVMSSAPGAPRQTGPGRRLAATRATPGRSGARCRSCGSPLTATSGRWVLRGNAVVLLAN